jgi:predicted MFS family arabinose efflux permease
MLAVSIVGVGFLTILPLLVGSLTEAGDLSVTEVGWIASSDTAGIILASVTAPLWVRRIKWRALVCGSLLSVVAFNLISTLFLDSFWALFSIRVLCGIGTGIAYAMCLACAGAHSNSERAFGYIVGAQVLYGVFSFWFLPNYLASEPTSAIFIYISVWSALALIVSMVGFPRGAPDASASGLVGLRDVWVPAVIVFTGLSIFYVGMGGVWAYVERIGDDAQLSASEVGNIIMIGYGISFFGALLCERVVSRIGRTNCLVLTAVVLIGSLSALHFLTPENALLLYAIATIIYQFFWSFALPAVMGVFNGVDDSGRIVTLAAVAFKVGEFIGPPAMAFGIVYMGFDAVILIGSISIAIGLAFLIFANQRSSDPSRSAV